MLKKAIIKRVFEELVSRSRHLSIGGHVRSVSYEIKIIGIGKSFSVALFCLPLGLSEFVIARSYPMSYESAYRLVCLL